MHCDEQAAGTHWTLLSRSAVWIQHRKIDNRYDLLTTVVREVTRAETTTVHCFINLMKAFDLVSRKGLFTLLQRIGCLPKNLRIRLEKACRVPSNRMAHPQTHFKLRVEWRRDVYLSQHSSASSSPYCCPMLSASQRMVYTSTWEAIEVSLTLHAYGRRLRCTRYSTRSCFLQMTPLSLPTPQKPSRDSSTALHMVQWL